VSVVDAHGILAAAAAQRVELLRDTAFPPPVRGVRCSVAADAGVHRFEADIALDDDDPLKDRLGSAVFGVTGPLGILLARRLAAADPVAARIVDSVGNAAAAAYRRLRPADAGPADAETGGGTSVEERVDEATGLRATVAVSGAAVTVRAVVASDAVAPAHVRAMACVVLRVVTELTGADALAGREIVLRRPVARAATGDGPDRVDLGQVGGLTDVVAQFREIAVSFRHPEVMARWGARRPQGILLYGPPGTGKTMLARALANEIGAAFREIRTPEILDKWLGASERNIKRIFREARRYREPTVMLFDEFDSIISYAGAGGDAASQAVNAVAGIFKQEMNGLIEENPNVIVVATTNFPQRVDDSLVRSGRFDVKLAIPVPDETGRAEILAKMIRRLIARHEVAGFRMFADDVDPTELARLSDGMTGADLKEVLRRVQLAKAMQEARTGAAQPISQENLKRSIADLQ
jgi:transitional endoplasmic reticulum ATPase